MNIIKKRINLNDGRIIEIETGKLAKQADGAVTVRMGNTILLATVVSSKEAKEGIDFLPLSVDYQEKFASAGKIPGGFLKREGKLSDYEVLISRLIDRVLRPLFPNDYHAETQVMVQLISLDKNDQPDALAGLAASAALMVSDIPFNGPISEVRVGRVNGQFVVNPTIPQMQDCDLDIMVGASYDSIVMVEGEMREVSEKDMLEAIKFAHEAIKSHCLIQKELAQEVGKTRREYSHENNDQALKERINTFCYQKCYEIAKKGNPSKQERKTAFDAVLEDFMTTISEEEKETLDGGLIKKYYHDVEKEAVRNAILKDRIRLDGRKLDEIRPIWSEVDYLPSAHGSAVFTRGETQSLTSVTLGTKLDEKMIDGAVFSGYNKFLLHYNFPSFSTGEARPNRGPGRREVGHGNLAERALKKVLPQDNPYTIRVVSDILESNGSSSMATVCAGSLALMDAGVKTKGTVSGIAMGLITDGTGNYAVLSDILGDEDHLGDMDFKVAGTADGITACQMDIKVQGLTFEILENALNQANKGREHIRKEMEKTISKANDDYKPHAPRMIQIEIPGEFIGAVIGPGGKVIQEIQNSTGATVVIEENEHKKGIVNISGVEKTSVDAALARIKAICSVPEVGEVYSAKVKSIMPYGAFVEFMPGHDGLLHISEVKWERLDNMEGIFEQGEEIKVKLIGIDKKTGKYKLSRKELLPKPEGEQA